MSYIGNFLELIKIVNDNYDHVTQLKALERLIDNTKPNVWLSQEEIDKLDIIIKTTHNSHYDYHLFLNPSYQIPQNHVNNFMNEEWLAKGHLKGSDDPMVVKELIVASQEEIDQNPHLLVKGE